MGSAMQPKRRRQVIIASIIVALAVGIIIVSIPYLPQAKAGTLTAVQVGHVNAGTSTQPGFLAFQIPSLPASQRFVLQVNATDKANFCVMTDVQYHSWLYTKPMDYGPVFPWNECVTQAGPLSQTSLSFTTTSSGTWDVVVLNSNPVAMNVTFSPAPV